jgi:hypothetical protein
VVTRGEDVDRVSSGTSKVSQKTGFTQDYRPERMQMGSAARFCFVSGHD